MSGTIRDKHTGCQVWQRCAETLNAEIIKCNSRSFSELFKKKHFSFLCLKGNKSHHLWGQRRSLEQTQAQSGK